MPRHRVKRTQRHRTLWPAGSVAGRVRLLAAGTRSRRPGHARPGTGVSWAWLGAGASRYLRDRRPMLTGAVRGLLVSPWFAAGAGFVIAAGAFVYAPHAQLKLGPAIAIRKTPCASATCKSVRGEDATAMPAGTGAGQVTPPPTAPSPATRRLGVADVTVSYYVLWEFNDRFEMLIRVRSKHRIGAWKLTFEIPGSDNLTARGVTWRSTGLDSGTASGSSWSGSQRQQGSGDQPGGAGDTVSFDVYGGGTGRAPGGCVYNGASCHFSAG